jgi:diguanylate cyclase
MAGTHRRSLDAGACLFREGDEGNCAFVVERGRIEISSAHNDSRKVLATLGPGEIFGEMALVDEGRRSATATALESTTLLVITEEYLQQRIEAADPMVRHLLHLLIRRSRKAIQRIHGTGVFQASELFRKQPAAGDAADRSVALQRLELEQALETALSNREFVLHYQPIVRVADNTVYGFEALIRWERPGTGLVMPGRFMDVVEQSDLMVHVGRWIVIEACQAAAVLHSKLREAGSKAPAPVVSINVSARQFRDDAFVETVRTSLETTGIEPKQLRLEVTETLLLNDMEHAISFLTQCRALGVRLALDDFGTGYSSLSYLHKFPVDAIKLDRSFVTGLTVDPAAPKIVNAMSVLARDLGLDVIAEGVEQPAEVEILKSIGIPYIQGFVFGRACALADAGLLVRRTLVPTAAAA